MRFAQNEMMHFLWILPLLGLLFFWSAKQKRRAIERFGSLPLMKALASSYSLEKMVWKKIFLILALFFMILSLARPQWGTKLELLKRKGLDIMIVLDCSLSMETQDVPPSRLEKAKNEIKHFMENLRGDRVGLVPFAGDAFVQCPLTLDYGAAVLFLESADTSLISEQGTAIGKALEVASGAFNQKERKYKVIVLITDGEHHGDNPVKIAREIAREGIRIYTIGIGTRKGQPIPMKDEEGRVREFKKDSRGEIVVSKLDELTLEEIALEGDGKYFRSTSGELELDTIQEDLQKMEKKSLAGKYFTHMEDRFQIPLFLGILFLFGESVVSNRRKVKKVWEGRFK